MKRLLLILFIISGTVEGLSQAKKAPAKRALAAGYSKRTNEFLEKVGFVSGYYESEGPSTDKCPFGNTRVRETNDTVALMMDEQILITDAKLGENRLQFKNAECSTSLLVSQSGRRVISKRDEDCGTDRFRYVNELTFADNFIIYKVQTFKNGKSNLSMSCRMDRQK